MPEMSAGASLAKDADVGIDSENAYGRAYISACLAGAREKAPRLATMAACEWQYGSTVWHRIGDQWEAAVANRGGWQGSNLMRAIFAAGMESALQRGLRDTKLTRIGYQDDTYVIGRASEVTDRWNLIEDELARVGHRLRAGKSQVWIPAYCDAEDLNDIRDVPEPVRSIAKHFPTVSKLTALGTTVCGECRVEIDANGFTSKFLSKRCDDALKFVATAQRMADAVVDNTCLHKIWLFVAKTVCHALDYDGRMLPSNIVREYADRLDREARKFAFRRLGITDANRKVNREAMDLARLPGKFGGMNFRVGASGNTAAATFLARTMSHEKCTTNSEKAGKTCPGRVC